MNSATLKNIRLSKDMNKSERFESERNKFKNMDKKTTLIGTTIISSGAMAFLVTKKNNAGRDKKQPNKKKQ